MKRLIKYFLLFIFSTSLVYAADAKPPATQEQMQVLPEEQPPAETEQVPLSYKGAFAKMMLTLLGLIVLVVLSVWMLRRVAQGRFHQMNQGRAIKILERRPLSAKTILYVIEIGRKKIVVAESQLEVRAVSSIDELDMGDED